MKSNSLVFGIAIVSIFLACANPTFAASDKENEWYDLSTKAIEAGNSKKFNEKEAYLKQALTLAESLGDDNDMLISSVRELGACLYEKGSYDTAEPLLNRALTLCEKKYGVNSPGSVACLNMLGRMKRHQEKQDEALKYASEAIRRYNLIFPISCPEESTLYHNLGRIYQKKNQLDEAEKMYRKAIDLQVAELNQDLDRLSTFYHNLGMLYAQKNDLEKAEIYATVSLKMRESAGLDQGKNQAINMTNLATIKAYEGDIKSSQSLYKASIDLFNKGVSPDPKTVGRCLSLYGGLMEAIANIDNKNACKKEYSVEHGTVTVDFSKLKDERRIPPLNIKPSVLKFLVASYPVQLKDIADSPIEKAGLPKYSPLILAAYTDHVIKCIESNKRPEFIEAEHWNKVLELWKKDKRTEALAYSFHPERGDAQIEGVMKEIQKSKEKH